MSVMTTFADASKDFAHDADLLGTFTALWDASGRLAKAKVAVAVCLPDDPKRDLLVGDLKDAEVFLAESIQHALTVLGKRAIEWLPKMLVRIAVAL